jgi:phosphate transport system permease protein
MASAPNASASSTLGVSAARKPPASLRRSQRPRERLAGWPVADRVAWAACWVVGVGVSLVTAAIVLLMAVKGVAYLHPDLLFEHPSAAVAQSQSGGFLDPIEGTLLLTAVGTAIAAPLGVAIAVWLQEYGRPAGLARATESAIEMTAGGPSVLFALFGLILFARPVLAFLSQTSAGGSVSGRSFLTAGAVSSLLALPLVVGATREALAQLPARLREASHALGKTRARTIRKVLLPSIRPGIAAGVVLGMGRIIGDTAIVIFVLGATLHLTPAGGLPGLSALRGEGTTLTAYVRYNSPAGEGLAPNKAYAAAFVLMLIVVALNFAVVRLGSGSGRSRPFARRRAARAGSAQ